MALQPGRDSAEQWGNPGSAYRDMKRHGEALESYRRALPLYRAAGAERKAELTRQNLENLEGGGGR